MVFAAGMLTTAATALSLPVTMMAVKAWLSEIIVSLAAFAPLVVLAAAGVVLVLPAVVVVVLGSFANAATVRAAFAVPRINMETAVTLAAKAMSVLFSTAIASTPMTVNAAAALSATVATAAVCKRVMAMIRGHCVMRD